MSALLLAFISLVGKVTYRISVLLNRVDAHLKERKALWPYYCFKHKRL